MTHPGHNLQNVFQEPCFTQRSNQEMVERGVFDGVPDIPETQDLKNSTTRTYSIAKTLSGTTCNPKIQPGDGGQGKL